MLPVEPSGGSSVGSNVVKIANRGHKIAQPHRGRGIVLSHHTTSHYSPPSHHSSGGGGGSSHHSSGGGGGGGRVSVPRAVKPKLPVVPSINSYLGTDSTYQQALTGGKRTLADYLSEIARRRGEAGTQYNQTVSNMNNDRTQQLDDIRQEFASRGLINSGLFGQEQGKFQQQFTDQLNALGQQQSGLLSDLLSQEKNYKRENDLALQQAKQEALARRAARYNIGA